MKKTMFTKLVAVIFGLAIAFGFTVTANAAVIDIDSALYAKAPEAVVANETDIETGDIDANGVINVIDVTLVQKYATGIESLNEAQLIAGDVNHDGDVDILDCTAIQKTIAGIK